jgi:hypothetical protein
MKAITTLTAVAALVLGMSIASAQTQPNMQMQTQSPNATGMKASPANAKKSLVKGSGKFCSVNSPEGKMTCKYASIEACQKDPNLKGRQCAANPGPSTTGAN